MTAPDPIATRVREIICDHLLHDRADLERVTLDASLRNGLGADSLDEVMIAVEIEDEYGIEIETEEMARCALVSDVVKMVKGKV